MNYEQPELMWYYRVSKYGIYVGALPTEESRKVLETISKKLKIKDKQEFHVTIAYSKLGDLSYIPYNNEYFAECMEFDLFGEDNKTLVIRLASRDLESRHANLRNKGYLYTFPEYLPHVTLCTNWEGDLPDSSILYDKDEPIELIFDNEYGEPLSE